MKKQSNVKGSVARKVTFRFAVLLLIAMCILLVGAYGIVYHSVKENNENYSKTILGIFADLIMDDAFQNNEPIDMAHTNEIIKYGDYICTWIAVDYTSVVVPDPENDRFTVLCVSRKEENFKDDPPMQNHWIGRVCEHKMTDEERAVWNGDALFAHADITNEFGHEMSTTTLMVDGFGNKAMATVGMSFNRIYSQIAGYFAILAGVILAVVFAIQLALYFILRKNIYQPAEQISQIMHDYAADGILSSVKLNESRDDEFGMIADAFNSMAENIDQYVMNINLLTQEQERQKTQMDIAFSIQNGLLPKGVFETPQYRINAMMKPAENVGGDLYDYLPLDDHRTLVVIADVSGKGLSAAIFMSVTLILIHQYAKMALSPSEILQKTNDTLAEKNPAMLFATAFVGIYDDRDHTLTYANAGHNPCYVKQIRDKGQGIKDEINEEPPIGTADNYALNEAKGTLLGLFPGEVYPQAVCQLHAGDTIFFYTDGVTESINSEKEFYDEAGLEAALAAYQPNSKTDIVTFVYNDVVRFADNEKQFDDITMLALTVKNSTTVELKPEIIELEKITAAILALPVDRAAQLDLCMAAEEWFDNLCYYAFEGKDPVEVEINMILSVSDRITMTFEDNGKPFDPLAHYAEPVDYDPDTQIGGLGIFIAFNGVDDVQYNYYDGKNHLTFEKYRN